MERAEHADAIAEPAYLVRKVKPEEIEASSRRTALDDWLSSPMGKQAEREKALLNFFNVRSGT